MIRWLMENLFGWIFERLNESSDSEAKELEKDDYCLLEEVKHVDSNEVVQ